MVLRIEPEILSFVVLKIDLLHIACNFVLEKTPVHFTFWWIIV